MTQETKKKLRINAALVDMTKTVEASLAAYSSISINAAAVLISEEVQNFVHKYPIKINAAGVVSTPAGCKVSMMNGSFEISPDSIVKEPTVLIANGHVTIHPGAEEALASFAKIIFNGHVLAPQSMRGAMASVTLNGSATYYPDDFTLVNGDLMVNNRFIRRAKQNESYYVTGKVLMTAPGLDVQQLIEKDVYFETGCAFLAESYSAVAELLSGKARIRTIPGGFDIVEGSLTIDESTPLRFGKKLYVMGGVLVPYDSAALYNRFEDIIVCGAITLPDVGKTDWLKVISKFEGIQVYKGAILGDMPTLHVNANLLDEYPDGVTIHDCACIEIDPSIPSEVLREKLHKLTDCASVTCGEEQLGLVQSRCEDCANVWVAGEKNDAAAEDDAEVFTINAAMYTL